MANWQKKINLRDLFEDFNLEADELEEIERIKPLWIERFNSIEELKTYVPKLKKVKTLNQFNRWLDGVYDYCDDNLIWIR